MFHCPKCNTTLDRNDLHAAAPSCPHCGETLNPFGQETAATITYNEPPSDGPPKPSVPGFEVGELIGRGGMGEVWEGRQTSLGGRRVAIKVLTKQRLSDSNAVTRFQHEAEALAALSHPNIVNVIDFCAAGGSNCLIMEYVEGDESNDGQPRDLLKLIDEGGLDSGRTRSLILQVAGALAYAHEKGIVHRDVKPANIMIDRFGNAKVADFGLAAIDRVIPSERLTVAGQAMGTPAYMAPEQFSDAKSVDHRADGFAAGIMLYEMLTGQLPKGTFVPPSEVVEGLDAGWDAIVARAMQPNREKRYNDMAEMAAAIESISGDATTTAMPSTRTTAADSSAMVSHSDNTCYSCRAPVTGDSSFCDACGASLRFECPRCGAEARGGVKFCPDCGIDVVKITQCQQQLVESDRELQSARVETQPVADRFAQAEKAGLLAARALKQIPDDERARSALSAANVLAVQLAAEAGETAYREKRLCIAIDFFQYICEVSAEHPIANKRLEEISQYRKKLLDKADTLIKEGSYDRAAKGLESLATQFEGDTEISRLLDDCRQKRSGKQDARDRMRALEQDRKLFELEELLAELKRAGTVVKGMEKYSKQLKEKLASIRSELARARGLLASGECEEAIAVGQWIIERAADCPEAEELVRKSREQIEAGSKPGKGRWLVRFILLLIVAGGIGYATKGFWFRPEYKTVNYWVTLVFEGQGEPVGGNPIPVADDTAADDDTPSADSTVPATDGTSGEATDDGGNPVTSIDPTKKMILDRHKVGKLAILDGHSRGVTGVAFHPDGNSAISVATYNDKVKMMRWDLESLKGKSWNDRTTYSPETVTYSPLGDRFACFHYANSRTPGIAILDQKGKLKILLSADGSFKADRFAFSPNGRDLLSAGADGHVRYWKDWKLTPAATSIKEYSDTVRAIAFTPDGKYCLASSGYESPTIDVFDLTGSLVGQFEGSQGRVFAVTVSPDGRQLVSLDVDLYRSYRSTLRVWEFDSNRLVKKIALDESQTCAAFSRDARFAIIGGKTGTVTLYNVLTGERIISWRTDQGKPINAVAISADSRFALSCGDDGKVRYWGLPKVTRRKPE